MIANQLRYANGTLSLEAADNGYGTTSDPNFSTGTAQINTVVTEGDACSPNGKVARDATGLLLSCQSGVWKSPAAGLACVTKSLSGGNYHGSTLSCDPGYTMTGGGCGWRSDGNNGFVYSIPNGNGWYCADYDFSLVNQIHVRCCK